MPRAAWHGPTTYSSPPCRFGAKPARPPAVSRTSSSTATRRPIAARWTTSPTSSTAPRPRSATRTAWRRWRWPRRPPNPRRPASRCGCRRNEKTRARAPWERARAVRNSILRRFVVRQRLDQPRPQHRREVLQRAGRRAAGDVQIDVGRRVARTERLQLAHLVHGLRAVERAHVFLAGRIGEHLEAQRAARRWIVLRI